ncbi:hypothetical protein NEUTE1DRAFT_80773 [Neurospora tetrasperma FGSC 2508]|uniref:CoA-dependent acyltransferase n=1 Tax=Neurospora tetrasperma (strain FGSC 2508 / ATCC MYA-4615 / P0657) TaxID=510951 RepID=F8MJM8_NEUT8|nr:uncharacterized protein NEUTE1DRAFT_80773 [Neurospora tetrasperma FGSC 2508]EGO57269.1 hypothetical protein NEUTE1DRAFT_80773 [Neurospora tetrasperma FGSC 2508]EGZ72483.1 hypothetical protein NEUTE2DRAFT_112098 [Neurospora tetrasperma FGSC 2509]
MRVLKAGVKRDDYNWRQIRPGLWQRDADEAEVFYSTLAKLYAGSGRMHFAITGHIALTISVPEDEDPEVVSRRLDESLRIAWLRQRYETPTIASSVHYDALDGKWKKSYRTIPDDASTKAWLERTFQVVSTGQTGEDWANSDPPAPTTPTLFVICPCAVITSQDPSTICIRRDLVLRSPHDIIDGIGTLHFLNSLVTKTTQAFTEGEFFRELPVFDGSEASNLSPPYRVAANIPSTPTPEHQTRLSTTKAPASQPLNPDIPFFEEIGIPYTKGSLLPGKHQRIAHYLSRERTSALITFLKNYHPGITVTHAFHAAIALTLRNAHLKLPSSSSTSSSSVKTSSSIYTNYLLRNERAACQPPYNTPLHCVSVYHSLPSTKLQVDMSSTPSTTSQEKRAEFETVLNHIKDYYTNVRDDPMHSALAPAIWANWTPVLPEAVLKGEEKIEVPKPKEVPSVSVSSMGVVDRILKRVHDLGEERGMKLEVHRPWVTGEELTNGLGVFLGTFDGELCLSCAFNEAWHDRKGVDEFLWEVERVVGGWVEGGTGVGGS